VLQQVEVNGQPGALLLDSTGKVIGVMALDIAGGQIQAVRAIVNPDKLRHIGPIGDLHGPLERHRQRYGSYPQ
jgi:RNA polymerase sigma-70 factor (ECF subfamily)